MSGNRVEVHTAPFDGQILPEVTAYVPPDHPPLPIARASLIGYAIPKDDFIDCQVSAYLPADSLRHVMAQAPARFRASGHSHLRVDATLSTIAASPAATLSAPEMAAQFGGPVAVTGAQMAPDGNWHQVVFSTPSEACAQPSAHVIVGTIHMKAARASLLERAVNRIAQVLVRELSY